MKHLNGSTNLFSLVKAMDKNAAETNKIQKLAYVLKKQGVPFTEKFSFNYKGLYSSDIEIHLSQLVEEGVLRSSEKDGNCVYEVNNEYLSQIEGNKELEKNKLIEYLANQDDEVLNVVSTIFYLSEVGYSNIEVLKKKVEILSPSLKGKISEGALLYQELLATV